MTGLLDSLISIVNSLIGAAAELAQRLAGVVESLAPAIVAVALLYLLSKNGMSLWQGIVVFLAVASTSSVLLTVLIIFALVHWGHMKIWHAIVAAAAGYVGAHQVMGYLGGGGGLLNIGHLL